MVLNLLPAFQRAEYAEAHIEAGLLPASARAVLAEPLIRHGILANRKVLETAAKYSLEQRLTPRLMRLD